MGAARGESLSSTSSKMGRLATAMATGMVTTMWMGTMSAPWILDGRMEELCKISIVEKRDYCNKENDKALTGKYSKRRSEHREWSTVVIVPVIFIS